GARAAAVLGFVLPAGSAWDAPVEPQSPPTAEPVIPGPEVWDLRTGAATDAAPPPATVAARRRGASRGMGSTNWAVAGARTASGAALVGNAMHLGLAVPPVWYRAWLTTHHGRYDLNGVTLAGVPALVAG